MIEEYKSAPIPPSTELVAEAASSLDEQILAILGESSLEAIKVVLSSKLDTETIDNLEIVEKINLFLVLASREKTVISPKIRQALKKINEILPGGKLDLTYLNRLGLVNRRRIIQVISSLVLLITFSLVGAKYAADANHENKSNIAIELPTDPLSERKQKELEARAKFERLYSEDLATVVAEMGWDDFLVEYAIVYDDGPWSPEEVFHLLTIQQPRYWGRFAVKYPEVFMNVVQESNFTLSDFISSCGSDEFFTELKFQSGLELNWLDVWDFEELLETLKIVNPDWMRVVISNQELFAGHLSKEDLPAVIHSLDENHYEMNNFLRNYDDEWEKSWSKRELLDAIMLESDQGQSNKWQMYVVYNSDLFKGELTSDEVTRIVEYISFISDGGNSYPQQQESLDFFSNYYKQKLYLIVNPQEFSKLIEQSFSADVSTQILSMAPEIDDLENRSI